MDLPPIDKSLLAKCGIAPMAMPLPVADYGLHIKREENNPIRSLSADEALKLFSPSEAVKMNYIPLMLAATALQQTTLFVNYCVKNRLSEFKKHTRVLKKCVESYTDDLGLSYGPAYRAYINYVNRYFDRIERDLQQMWFTVGNIANKEIPRDKNREIATHIAIIHNLLNYTETLDCKTDKIITEKLNEPVHRRQDRWLQLITAMCVAIEDDYGLRLSEDPLIERCIQVLANRASFLVDDIICEEDNVSKR